MKVLFIFKISSDSICIDITWSCWTCLLRFEITKLVFSKLRTNKCLFNLLTTQRSFSGVELSDIMGQSFLYSSEIVERLDHFCLCFSAFKKSKSIICFNEVLFQGVNILEVFFHLTLIVIDEFIQAFIC